MDRLAALEAEVKADADAQKARKEAALEKVRDQRAKQLAENQDLRDRQAALVTKKKPVERQVVNDDIDDEDASDADNLRGALELAGKANRVRKDLTRKPKKGQKSKSWLVSGGASLVLGPLGWLYAGSLREAVPASVGWILLMTVLTKILPSVLLMPVLMLAMPLSMIAGVVYAMAFNKHGSRQRLFNDEKKQLKSGDE
ncbi:MAG TPA: hypothetical protein VL326_33660 [Kofleriaceae bacterium]|jgi:hypothetical protein|nr:hypothetical protein [Kofleriaceae bacterium]